MFFLDQYDNLLVAHLEKLPNTSCDYSRIGIWSDIKKDSPPIVFFNNILCEVRQECRTFDKELLVQINEHYPW